MALNCGLSILKYILFVINLICALCGLALISVGTIALSQYETIKTEAEGGIITGAAISLIIIGLIIFVISFLGCCGAIKESYCMTTTYGVIMLILAILQLYIAIGAFSNTDELNEEGKRYFNNLWEHKDVEEASTQIDVLQDLLGCCGKNSPMDYGPNIPKSCNRENGSVNEEGCTLKMGVFVVGLGYTVAGGAILTGIIELVAFIAACCVGQGIKKQQMSFA